MLDIKWWYVWLWSAFLDVFAMMQSAYALFNEVFCWSKSFSLGLHHACSHSVASHIAFVFEMVSQMMTTYSGNPKHSSHCGTYTHQFHWVSDVLHLHGWISNDCLAPCSWAFVQWNARHVFCLMKASFYGLNGIFKRLYSLLQRGQRYRGGVYRWGYTPDSFDTS